MLDNINPQLWGPTFWKMLHFVILAYPHNPTYEDKANIQNFFYNFQHVIPCEKCRNNFKNHLVNHPLDEHALSSKTQLMLWLINVHNDVNIMLHKKVMPIGEAMDKINKLNSNSLSNNNTTIITLILLFILVVIMIVYVRYRA